ncbi:MAG: MIP family channel protein [Clostridia bacterium]|nr:MIP family channel protein [Clostridia bacterium]
MKKLIAEFIGTMILVIFGCGSAVAANTLLANAGEAIPLALSTLLIAFAFGLVIVAMAYSIGNISGCHINPAVSFSMLLSGRMTAKEFGSYVIAQILGGIVGAGILALILGSTTALGANGFDAASAMNSNMLQAILVEVILTFTFCIAILGVTSKVKNASVAGLVIGLTLTLVHIFGVPFTGTSVNPARSIGPALFTGGLALEQLWVFIVAPLAGAALAAIAYKSLAKKEDTEEIEGV